MPTPKSKETKRKMRRWSYEVHVTKANTPSVFQSPALTIGTAQTASETAKDMRDDLSLLPQFEGASLSVKAIGHETVSDSILSQITGLSDENKVLIKAIRTFVTKNVHATMGNGLSDEDVERQITEGIGQAVLEARGALIAEKQAKAEQIAAAMTITPTDEHVGADMAHASTDGIDPKVLAKAGIKVLNIMAPDVELPADAPQVQDALTAAVEAVTQRISATAASDAAQAS